MAALVSTLVQVHVARRIAGRVEHLVLQRAASETVAPLLWQCVTGHIRDGETAVAAARREISEECGLLPIELWVLPIVSQFYSVAEDAIVSVPVFAAVVSETQELSLSDEHCDAKWLEHADASTMLCVPAQRNATQVFDDLLQSQRLDPAFQQLYRLQ